MTYFTELVWLPILDNNKLWINPCYASVTQSCLTLCDPMDCSTPSLPVHHQFPSLFELLSIESVIPSHHLILCHPLLLPLSIFPSIRVFCEMSQFFISGGQSIGVSAWASVLPMDIQDWFPLGWTGWISWQSKGLSRVFWTNIESPGQQIPKDYLRIIALIIVVLETGNQFTSIMIYE